MEKSWNFFSEIFVGTLKNPAHKRLIVTLLVLSQICCGTQLGQRTGSLMQTSRTASLVRRSLVQSVTSTIAVPVARACVTSAHRVDYQCHRGDGTTQCGSANPAHKNPRVSEKTGRLTLSTGAVFTTSLWAHNPNSYCSYFKNNDQIRWQFCTCHGSSAVLKCSNLWPDDKSRIIIRTKIIFTRFQLWAHKPFVKWMLGEGGRLWANILL